jgi:hypothetical protein
MQSNDASQQSIGHLPRGDYPPHHRNALARGAEYEGAEAAPSKIMAEGEGFEPPIPCGIPVFKTGAFNRSATPPESRPYSSAVMRSSPPM